jgi:hypothetical protein
MAMLFLRWVVLVEYRVSGSKTSHTVISFQYDKVNLEFGSHYVEFSVNSTVYYN